MVTVYPVFHGRSGLGTPSDMNENKQANGSGNGASLFIVAVEGEPIVDIQESLSTLGWEVTQ
jgi:hypothetical protein